MSWEATQWANRQRMKDAQTQIVLLVLANCADPDGLAFGWRKGRQHWDQYLVAHCRLSRASIFRKIKDLKELGLADPQVILHDDGRKQHVVQLDLNRVVSWVEGERDEEGRYTVECLKPAATVEVSPEDASATLDDAILAHDFESQAETEKLVRGVFRHAIESQAETGIESHTETQQTPAPQAESHPETKRVSLVRLQESPLFESQKKEIPQTPLRASGEERPPPIGFNLLKRDYPQADVISMRVWERAAGEFAKLSTVDQGRASEAAPRYRVMIAKFNRKPINPDKWIREREFERYSAASIASLGSPRVFVAQGTEPWEAWCNVLGVLYGDATRIPKSYQSRGPRGEHGIVVPSEWPLGGAGWLVPMDQWVFVEQYTPNFNRFNERMVEIFGRSIVMVRCTGHFVKAHHGRIGRGPDGALSSTDAMGALVPGEWPPPKGDAMKLTVSDELKAVLA